MITNHLFAGIGGGGVSEMYMQCRPIVTNEVKCRAHALTSKPYCYFATRLHRRSPKRPAPVA